MPRPTQADTPFARRLKGLGMDLTDLRRALHHGEDRSTVTHWVYERRPVDPVVDALVACLERLSPEQRAEALAPEPDVGRDRIGIVRLLRAYALLPDDLKSEVRAEVVLRPSGSAAK